MQNPSQPPSGRQAGIAAVLQGIVGRVLRIDPREIDPEVPFLELGADSLALVEALRGLQESFGVKMTIRQLFEQYPSIAVLAAHLETVVPPGTERTGGTPGTAVSPAPVQAPLPAAPAVSVAPAAAPAPPRLAQAPVQLQPAAPLSLAGGTGVERVLGMQIQAFNQLVTSQLQALSGARWTTAAAAAPVQPAPAAPQASAAPAPAAPVLPTFIGKGRTGGAMNERQQRHLQELIERYSRRTAKSKELAQRNRAVLADSRAAVGFRANIKEIVYPLSRGRALGSRLWDVDGNEYVDLTMGMGVHLFGHHPAWVMETIERQVREGFELGPRSEVVGEAAALFCELTGNERATFTNSGTEAVMTAIRLARARTGRMKIVMFAGSYHGHSDGTLAQTQEVDGELRSFPVAPGIPPKVAEDVLVLDYGAPESLAVIRKHAAELAAVIVEPVQSRRPQVQPREFLHELRKLTAETGIALIFDEMICGFRLHLGGGQAWYGVRADLATYGKIVGGGLPIGVVAGKADFMDGIDGGFWQYGDASAPTRETTFFGGTFCQHPLAMAAAKRVLTYLKEQGPGLQEGLNRRTDAFAARLNQYFEADEVPIRMAQCSSFFRFNFSANADLLFFHLVERGVYVWEWRNCFLSTAHTDADLDFLVQAVQDSVADLRRGGFLPEGPSGGGGGGGERKERPLPPPPTPVAVSPVAPASRGAGGADTSLAFWDRQGKPSIAPSSGGAPLAGKAAFKIEVPADAPPPDPDRELFYSLYFFGAYDADFKSDKYELIFDCARYADRHGFSALWFPERHFHRFGGISPNPSVLAAALARETERIALRAGSVVLPLHHPLRVAEEWAVVDNLSGGRVGLSYASGWHPNDFTLSPENYGRHRELMFERIAIVERLWRGEAVRFKDGAGQDVDLRIYPLPARRDLPGWITIVNNPDTYRRAGEMGAGVLTNLMGQTPETLAEMLAIYRDALRRGGHPPEAGHVTLLLHTFVLDDPEKAVEIARRPFYEYLKSSVGLLKNMIASEKLELDFDRLSDEDMEYILELAYGRYVRSAALIGSPETVAPIVERLREVGVDEIACLIDFGVDRDTVAESLPWLDALKERTRFREGPRGRQSGGAGVVAARSEPVPAEFDLDGHDRVVARFPLTELQGDLYVLSQMGEDSSRAYNEFSVLHLEGPLEVPLLHRAFQLVVDRHEALRTVFPSGEGQEVLAALDMPLPVVDASALPPERRAEVREALLYAEARRPFDFVRGPMFRVSLARLAERSHVLSICFHHIAADGLSVVLVGREALTAYEALRGGVRPALPPPYQYRQYAEWLQRPERAASLAADEAYWRSVLTPPLPVFDPPTDRPRPPFQTYEGHRLRAAVPAASWEPLRPFARRQGATFYVALLALYTALLHRWTGQDDHIVSAPANRRPLEGGDSLVGHCIDIVPLRTRFDAGEGSPSFLAWLKTVRSAVFDAQEHADYPFARLIRLARALDPARDPGRPPLIEVVYNPDPVIESGRAGGLEVEVSTPVVPFVKYDLALHTVEGPGDLLLYFDHRIDLFDRTTLERLAGQLRLLLEGAIADPARPLAEVPLLTPAERDQLLGGGEGTGTAEPFVPVLRRVEAQAARRPDAPAVSSAAGVLTYGDLDRQATRLAAALRRRGVGPESTVALWLDRSAELAVAALGVWKAGAAYLPIDPAAPAGRLAWILKDSGAALLLTSRQPVPSPAEELPDLSALPVPALLVESIEDPDLPAAAAAPAPETPAAGLAYVIYTSGSTGEPKGTALAHAGLANLVDWHIAAFGLNEADRTPLVAGPSFDASVWEMWPALAAGATLAVPPPETVTSPPALLSWLAAEKITVGFLPTPLAEAVLAEPLPADLALRVLLTGGDRLHRTASPEAPFTLFNCYGPTEVTVVTTAGEVESRAGGRLPSIGAPIANTRVYVLDRHLRPVPAGWVGELCVAGIGLARGYLGRPDLTAEKLVPEPFGGEEGGRLYRTGDLARWTESGLDFLGRADHQVKIRGLRIEPGEIEAVLARSPEVKEAAVVVRRDPGGDDRLVACLVPAEGSTLSISDLRSRLADTLPPYMVPAGFAIVPALPRTATGKVDRRALALHGPEPDAAPRAAAEGPRTPVEEVVAGLWAQLPGFGVASGSFGVHDNFFHLGGHSLLATQLLVRLRDVFGVQLSLRAFFREPTVAGLARQIEAQTAQAGQPAAAPAGPPPLTPVPRDRRLLLSFGQERLWLIDQLQPGSGAYNSYMPVLLQGRLDRVLLERVLSEIVRRHEVLRTTYGQDAEGPFQVLAPATALGAWRLPVVDLSGLPGEASAETFRRLNAEEGRRPFDLARGPLYRATLLRTAPAEHVLLLSFHHSVCDAWSLGVLTRELGALYRSFSAGLPSPLEELPLQYADYAQWQRAWLQGPVYDEQLAFWRQALGERPPVLELPTDRPRPRVQTSRGGYVNVLVSPEVTRGLEALARERGATLFIALVAAFQWTLAGHAGQDRVSVGTPVAGRTRPELEGLIGFFVNTVVVSPDLSGQPTAGELVDRVRDVTLAAFDHQDFPFERVVAALEHERDLSRQPLFQALFSLQNTPPPDLDLPGLELKLLPPSGGLTQFDVVLGLEEYQGGVVGVLSYNADLFDAPRMEGFVEDLQRVLAGMAAGADTPLERPVPLPGAVQASVAEVPADASAQEEAARAAAEAARQAELEKRRGQLSSRKSRLSADRKALLSKWVKKGDGNAGAGDAEPAAGEAAPVEKPDDKPLPVNLPVTPLVPIQPIQPGSSRPPIFLVHPANGNAHPYLALARHLGPDQPLYAFQSVGITGGEPLATVDAMVERYLEEIRKIQPHGPYHLGGWCVGGMIVYRMAEHLLAQGEAVEPLLLIDSHAPTEEIAAPSDEADLLASLAQDFGGAVGINLRLPSDELRRIPPDQRLDWVVGLARQNGVLPESFDINQARRHWEVFRANVRALESLRLAPGLPVGALLFRADDQPDLARDWAFLGWDRLLAGPIEKIATPGDHYAVIRDPVVRDVAREIAARLPAAMMTE